MQTADAGVQASFDREYRPALMAFFLRRVRNPADAEDLTQEVFIRIAASVTEGIEDAEAYIFQVAANLLKDRARRRKVRDDYAFGLKAEGAGVETLDPHRVAAGREALSRLVEGIGELPERTRRIFLLFRYENLSRKMIAESFGISTSAVDKHIYRAMAHLMTRVGAPE